MRKMRVAREQVLGFRWPAITWPSASAPERPTTPPWSGSRTRRRAPPRWRSPRGPTSARRAGRARARAEHPRRAARGGRARPRRVHAGLAPPDEEAAKALIGNAWKALDGISAMEALDRVSEAVADSLRDGPLPRDDFHQALRERLPEGAAVVVPGLRQPPRPPLPVARDRRARRAGDRRARGPQPRSSGRRPRPRRWPTRAPSWRGASWAATARRGHACSPSGRGWRPPTPRRSGSAPASSPRWTWRGRSMGPGRGPGRAGRATRRDGRAPAAEPRPAQRGPRPRAARARRRRCASGCGRPSAARAPCSPAARWPACGARPRRASGWSSPSRRSRAAPRGRARGRGGAARAVPRRRAPPK